MYCSESAFPGTTILRKAYITVNSCTLSSNELAVMYKPTILWQDEMTHFTEWLPYKLTFIYALKKCNALEGLKQYIDVIFVNFYAILVWINTWTKNFRWHRKNLQQPTKYRRHSISTKVCIGIVKHNASLVACIVQNSMHIRFLCLIYYICCEFLQNFHESEFELISSLNVVRRSQTENIC